MEESDRNTLFKIIGASESLVKGPIQNEFGELSEDQIVSLSGLLSGFMAAGFDLFAPRSDGRTWQSLFQELKDELIPEWSEDD